MVNESSFKLNKRNWQKEYLQQNGSNIGQHSKTCSLVPPIVLKKIIKTGNKEQRAKALKNLMVSTAMRRRRERHVRHRLYGMFTSTGGQRRRLIYDAENTNDYTNLPGKLIHFEGESDLPGDEDANKAYENSGHTYNFFKEVFDRTSIDNDGMPLQSCVRFMESWDNAQWTGQYMVYGEGGGEFLKRGVLTDLTPCAHELTHEVTEIESNLNYSDEAGGLNESMSDVFAIMCDQWVKKQTVDKSHWLIVEGGPQDGQALRSMKDPGTAFPDDSQISSYKDFDSSMDPHISSGIPNKAFYLTCMEIGGYSWEKIGKIWYIALKDGLKEDSTFQDMANITFSLAGQLFEQNVQKAVLKGWEEVKVRPKSIAVEISLDEELNMNECGKL